MGITLYHELKTKRALEVLHDPSSPRAFVISGEAEQEDARVMNWAPSNLQDPLFDRRTTVFILL